MRSGPPTRSPSSAGAIAADNTDAPALIAALPIEIAGAAALVLGAGGAARAAVWALRDAGAGEVRVWNRTPERARELCAQLGGTPVTEADGGRPADQLHERRPRRLGVARGPADHAPAT